MIYSVLVTSAIIAGTLASDDTDKDRPELAVYQSAAAAARRDPDAHVHLALWCEAHGLTAERIKHLSLAVLSDPSHALARGLMGLVAYRGKWDRPEVVG